MIKEKLITQEQMLKIMDFGDKAVIKIKKQDCSSSGFLCISHFPDKTTLPVLITNNHMLNENDITVGKKIDFSLNDDKTFYQILIDESRKVYTSNLYDVTFIEIKKNDGLDISSFIEVDPNIFFYDDRELNNKQVILLSYPEGKELAFSNGIIKNLENDGYHIKHLCNTTYGCAGGPIIDKDNFHVIAVHQGTMKNKSFNLGIFLRRPLEEFIKINN